MLVHEKYRSPILKRSAVVVAAVLVVAPALARQSDTGAPVSSGMIVTGHGSTRTGTRSKVSPSHPAPATHVTQPSDKLHNDPNVVKEQVAPTPDKPVSAPGAATTAPGNPGG